MLIVSIAGALAGNVDALPPNIGVCPIPCPRPPCCTPSTSDTKP